MWLMGTMEKEIPSPTWGPGEFAPQQHDIEVLGPSAWERGRAIQDIVLSHAETFQLMARLSKNHRPSAHIPLDALTAVVVPSQPIDYSLREERGNTPPETLETGRVFEPIIVNDLTIDLRPDENDDAVPEGIAVTAEARSFLTQSLDRDRIRRYVCYTFNPLDHEIAIVPRPGTRQGMGQIALISSVKVS